MRIRIIAFAALAPLVASGAAAQSVKAGVEAWQRGDQTGAIAIWKPLAAKGDADAAFNLGQANLIAKGVPTNLAEAQRWFEVAARKGHVPAQAKLGLMLFSAGNRPAAIRWLKLAAEASEPRAMLMYGTALYNGDSVAEDPIKGYAYVTRAAAAGLAPANATLADMNQSMSPDQRQKGAALAQTMVRAPKANSAVASKPAPTKTSLPVPPAPKQITTAAPASGGWRIQLGAFSQRSSAEALFARLAPKLGGRQAYFVPVGSVTRLQAGPFPTKAAAATACVAVKPTPCFPVPGR
nr:SPOR domain-containing protein [uncultured Sphingomonas sp.]